jgi:siroheme synthase
MGVSSLPAIIASLLEAGRPADTPVALIQQGTLPAQKLVTGTLANILEISDEIQSPAIIVIGKVVDLHASLAWFEPQLAEARR